MGKSALLFTAALLSLCFTPLYAQTGAAPASVDGSAPAATGPATITAPNHVTGYTAWDDDYLYIALQVNKPTLHGTNTEPFSNPLQDDAALISIQTDDDHNATRPTAHTVLVAVSATGGIQLYSGSGKTPLFTSFKAFTTQLQDILENEKDPDKREAERAALLGKLIKYQVMPKGAKRETGTSMPGYTAEIGIPWTDLGGKPAAGTKMGFNVVTQSTTNDTPAVMSLSPSIQTLEGVDNPSLWGEILFSDAAKPSQNNLLICPYLISTKPVIDGEINEGEWNGLSAFVFDARGGGGESLSGVHTLQARSLPKFTPHPPRPVVPLAAPAETTALPPHRSQSLTHLVLARYDYDYQADPRKAAPIAQVVRGDGSTALAHHPFEGAGPWFSYDRADWHRQQLVNLRQAGIDVILPVYRGAPQDRRGYADKGLTVLAAALQNLRETGQDYPQVGLFFDGSDLTAASGGRPITRADLFTFIRDFYRHIPAPFRFIVPLSTPNGGRTACPIFLSHADAFTDLDASLVDYLRGRFAQEFDGADLLVLGTPDFKPKAALDGYFAETGDKGLQLIDGGWIKTASVGAGYDGELTAANGSDAAYRPRRNGDTYREDWMAAIGKQPDWVLVDGWNDYATASEVAPSFETGYSASDITKEFTRRWIGLDRRDVRFLWHDTPRRMLAGRTYAIAVRAQNAGIGIWGQPPAALIPVGFAYRWLKGGQVVGAGSATPIPGTVLGGQDVNGSLSVRTMGTDSAPLPAGDYTLEIGVAPVQKRGEVGTFLGAGETGTTLQLPVTITANTGDASPAWVATLMHTDLPTILEAGGVYRVQVGLRNDSAQPWRQTDGARITLRLYRTEPKEGAEGGVTESPVTTADATAVLTEDVAPGQVAEVHLELPLTDPEGKPLPAWNQDDAWTYTARWEVADGSGHGVSIAPMPVALVNFDFGVHFLLNGTPASLPAEKRLPIRLSLQNDGPQTWLHDAVRVGYHWYYEDGTEYTFDDETTPIAHDVAPGEKITDMLAWLTPPPNDGTYYLVWDLKVGDTWASTSAGTRAFDEIVQPVQVINGNLTLVDLSTAFNTDGISDDDAPRDGDFDGKGGTFPAALLPPYAVSNAVPDGIWLPNPRSGPDSPRRISFRWGPKDIKQKNFVACQGQRLELGKSAGKCRFLHILAATTGKEIATNLKLIFQEPTEQSEDLYAFTVEGWDKPSAHTSEVAFLARHHNGPQGALPGAVALYDYMIAVPQPRKLVAIQLPDEPGIKIAAITIEK